MSEHEDLIAEACEEIETWDMANGTLIPRLVGALEQVTAERDSVRNLQEQTELRLRYVGGKREQAEAERDQLAAQIEVARNALRYDGQRDYLGRIYATQKALSVSAAPSAALDRVKAEARESVVTPEAREHWEWAQKSRRAHGDRGCVCALCGVMERVYEKGESNDQ